MQLKKISIAIAGSTGFVGLDLVNLLSKHPNVEIKYLCAQKNLNKPIGFFDKRIKKKLPNISNLNKIDIRKIDLLFLSLPNGAAQKIIKKYIKYKHLKFIDLSADFRLTDPKVFKYWYGLKHMAPNLIKDSLYSITEFVKENIKKYRIIANPGCYPTSVQLALVPLLKKKLINSNNLIIDSKSGYSGAGKNYKDKFNHKNFYNSIFAYSVNKHRHMAEIDQELYKINKKKINFTFNPHLLPVFRGLISSMHVEIKKNISILRIHNELRRFHIKNKFIKILKVNSQIGTGNVLNTNMCEISVCKTRFKNRIVIFSAIDNLIKGAAGQAIQNMNLMYGYKEKTGL